MSTHSNMVNGPEGNISLSFITGKEMPLNFYMNLIQGNKKAKMW